MKKNGSCNQKLLQIKCFKNYIKYFISTLVYDLHEKIKIAGRIPPATVWDYIKQVSEAPTKEVLLLSLLPTSKDERTNYLAFYNYLKSRDR